jgi:hypothetical protein
LGVETVGNHSERGPGCKGDVAIPPSRVAVTCTWCGERDFGGLVVSILASVSRVRGFKPDRSRRIFYVKILSMPSFGGEVKLSLPCPNFGACNRTQQPQFITGCWQNSYVEFPSFANRGLSCRMVRSASGDEGRNYSDLGHKGPAYKA